MTDEYRVTYQDWIARRDSPAGQELLAARRHAERGDNINAGMALGRAQEAGAMLLVNTNNQPEKK